MIARRHFYRTLLRCFEITRHREGELRVSYHPPDPRFDSIWELLGQQSSPCHYALSPLLKDALFFHPERVTFAEVVNVSEDYLGLDDHFIGWTFTCRYEEEPECLCAC